MESTMEIGLNLKDAYDDYIENKSINDTDFLGAAIEVAIEKCDLAISQYYSDHSNISLLELKELRYSIITIIRFVTWSGFPFAKTPHYPNLAKSLKEEIDDWEMK